MLPNSLAVLENQRIVKLLIENFSIDGFTKYRCHFFNIQGLVDRRWIESIHQFGLKFSVGDSPIQSHGQWHNRSFCLLEKDLGLRKWQDHVIWNNFLKNASNKFLRSPRVVFNINTIGSNLLGVNNLLIISLPRKFISDTRFEQIEVLICNGTFRQF